MVDLSPHIFPGPDSLLISALVSRIPPSSYPPTIRTQLMTKAEAIREAARHDPSMSNEQIKKHVMLRHNLVVSSSHINNLLGPYAKRKHLAPTHQDYMHLAEKCLAGFGGDRRLALTFLNLV